MKTWLLPLAVSFLTLATARAAPPVVSNVRASQLAGTKNVEILYDVSDADGGTLTIGVEMSGDGGATYTIPATALSGHVGPGVAPGLGRRIVWNAGADWNQQHVPNARARVTAFDGTTPVPPPGMVYIPAGTFQMGDNLDNTTDALPVHTVTLNYFFMDRDLWESVRTWAIGHGYVVGGGGHKGVGHPVLWINWYEAVKWCNARSEKDGLVPCYYTDTAQTLIYKSGDVNVTNVMVKWTANGYRLPTEAEWEKAARGGSLGLRFPWGNTIAHSQANYYAFPGNSSYDISPSTGRHPTYNVGGDPTTSPVGSFAPNNYGLYDMAGNAWEWCWDWHASNYYGDPAANDSPRGPATGSARVHRGGYWADLAGFQRCAARGGGAPVSGSQAIGFRCVRGL